MKIIIPLVKTLKYSQENIDKLISEGYKKSPVCKPYSTDKVLRYDPKRMVYWYSTSKAAHMSDCEYTRQNTGTLFII